MEILSADMRAATEVLQGVTSMELSKLGRPESVVDFQPKSTSRHTQDYTLDSERKIDLQVIRAYEVIEFYRWKTKRLYKPDASGPRLQKRIQDQIR